MNDQAGGSATRILVANQQELDAALAAATGGETIALLSGEYDSIRLWSRNFDSDVRLVSADPDAPATITGDIRVSSVSNFSIEGVDLIGDAPLAAYGSRITIQDSSNVRVADMTLTGTVPDSGVDPNDPSLSPIEALRGMPHEYGVKITGSSGVTLDALDITTMYKGVIVDKSADIAITNSEFHDLRSDGVNFVDTSDLRIEGNYFHDFTPWLNQGNGTGDHPDFIQYWGAPGGAGIDGVVIRDNIMLQGEGDLVQSIFGHFGPRGADSDPFTNFEVSGNFIQTNHVHGIALGDVSGGQIFGNVLIPSGMDIASPGDGG
ncbi:right-handed parallel beta-helix repeat-containing protein, partial [Pikeienuella sp. HZG-20]|uniref:right-handed parallel beta-helix repeat-containing protein n=1 Tax=Paludibacillus litoralis TaxID=3133267 RepID=UPI0030EC6E10